MTPDELRALAEKLFVAMSFHDPDSGARKALIETVAYLRAQADAQPVARIYTDAEMVHRDERWGRVQWIEPESELAEGTLLYAHAAPAVPAGWKLMPVEPTKEWLEVGRKAIEDALVEWRDERLFEPNRANGCVIRERDGKPSNVIRFGPETALRIGYRAMIAAAPAAPQAEPRVVASFYTEDAELVGTTHAPIKRVEVEDDGTLHVFIDHWPQAVPKREPLSDEWLARKAFLLGIPLWTLTVIVRAVECAHEIGGSDD